MASPKCILNFNVGVLGHIDSGKTSLAKALSTVASTASFDKNPQSKERGITLDLGFSSFCVDIPEHLKTGSLQQLQFTLVDCPGHASLIRTIIGGAQIIDLMMLVVDVTKGVQTQTAECLVIGEITCSKMIIVLNKIDLLPEAKQTAAIEKMSKRLLKTLENTRFANSPIVPVAAKPGGPEAAAECEAAGVSALVELLKSSAYVPQRDVTGPFIYSVDHCFSIRGQGTVMTGTVLSGRVAINDNVEIASMKVTKKVKSMQMFKKPVNCAEQGDRVGLCVTQFDPKQLERGLLSTPGALPTVTAAIVSVKRIPYFKGAISTRAKFHVTMGHETVMAKVQFFGLLEGAPTEDLLRFDYDLDYLYQDELVQTNLVKGGKSNDGATAAVATEHESRDRLPFQQYALMEFERPITCAYSCLVIASRLDTDIHVNTCRLAFHGRMLEAITDAKYSDNILPKLRIYKDKTKEAIVERKVDDYSVICKGLFKKESNMELFVGLKVTLSTGERGMIEGGFGQSGKFKVRIPAGLSGEASQILVGKSKKGKGKMAAEDSTNQSAATPDVQTIRVSLAFKRYVYDPKKRMIQA